MEYNPRVQIIPAKPKPWDKRVAIYARVSSNSVEQLNSLTAQISGLTRLIAANPTWLLVDTYIDIASSKTGSYRKEFNRLLSDCNAKKIDIVITKNISRFGRYSLEILSTLEQLKETNTRVIFETEELDTEKTDSRLMISIIESFAQAENESRSDNIKWGNKQHAADGTSKLYHRKCYGYNNDGNGKLIIVDEEAEVVKMIFDWYLQGDSIGVIIKKLKQQDIKTPTGKDGWSKRTIDTMLSNEKYKGDMMLEKTFTEDYLEGVRKKNVGQRTRYYVKGSHPAIISPEIFDKVQEEMLNRARLLRTADGNQISSGNRYSSKYLLSDLLACGDCGGRFRRRTERGKIVWRCGTRREKGKGKV